MKLELRKYKYHEKLSEETPCFSADVYADGKKFAEVSNDGHGGANRWFYTDRDLAKKVEAWAATQETKYPDEKLDQLLDKPMRVAELLPQFKRWCKAKTMFRLKGDAKDQWRQVTSPFTPAVKKFLVEKYGDTLEFVLNEDIQGAAERY